MSHCDWCWGFATDLRRYHGKKLCPNCRKVMGEDGRLPEAMKEAYRQSYLERVRKTNA